MLISTIGSVALVVACMIAPRGHVAATATGGILLLVILVHLDFDSRIYAVGVLGCLVASVVGVVRTGGQLRVSNVPLFLFITYVSMVGLISTDSIVRGGAEIVQGAMLASVMVLVGSNSSNARDGLRVVAYCAPILELAISLNELFLAGRAPWPRRDGTTFRNPGINNVLQILDGRAMGSMGWAITLGVLSAVCFAILVEEFSRTRSIGSLLSASCALIVIVLSGTRSAALSAALTLALLIVCRTRNALGRTAVILAVSGTTFAAFKGNQLSAFFGFDQEFSQTLAFEHRSTVISSAGELMDRPIFQAIFGGGKGSAIADLRLGVLGSGTGILATDNDFIRIVADYGMLGLTLLLGALWVSFKRGTLGIRLALIAFGLSMLTYDVLTWTSLTVLFVCVSSALRHDGRAQGSISPMIVTSKNLRRT